MTKVRYGFDGDRAFVEAKGHATGSETVCAGVSAILFALAGYLKNDEGAHILAFRLTPGDALLRARGGKEMRGAFEGAVIGLLQLAKSYGDFVSAEEIENF